MMHVYVHVHTCMQCLLQRTYTYISTSIHAYIIILLRCRTYTYMHAHIHTYIHTHIHTYIHNTCLGSSLRLPRARRRLLQVNNRRNARRSSFYPEGLCFQTCPAGSHMPHTCTCMCMGSPVGGGLLSPWHGSNSSSSDADLSGGNGC